MNRLVYVTAGVLAAIPLLAAAGDGSLERSHSRWSAERRLTFRAGDSQTSYNFSRHVAVGPSGTVHAVWFNTRDGLPQVYTKRSKDGGATWGPDARLSRLDARSEHPAVAVAGSSVYVVWHRFQPGGPEIVLRRSTDGGSTWGAERRLGEGAHAAVAASGRRVRVAWGNGREGQAEVYTRGSNDSGVTWSEETRISELPYESWVATVEIAGPRVWVAWVDYADANEEEYVRRSLDGGATWEPVERLTEDDADSWASSLAVTGDTLHLVWFDRRDAGVSDRDVEAKLDEALTLVGLTPPPSPPRDPAVYYLPAFTRRLEDKMHALQAAAPVWVGHGGDKARLEAILHHFYQLLTRWTYTWEIYYKRSNDGGLTWGPDVRLTHAPGLSLRPSIAVSGQEVYVVWIDGRDGQAQVYAKRSPDGGSHWGADERLSRGVGNPLDDAMRPGVAAAAGAVYVVWTDRRDGNAEIYFRRRVGAR